MPAPTVKCFICGSQVSKRSTLDVRGERACRTHPEVQMFVDKEEKEREEKERWAKAEKNLKVLGLASGARVVSSMTCLSAETIMMRIRTVYGAEMEKLVRDEVDRMGGFKMSEDEVRSAIAMGAEMARRVTEAGKLVSDAASRMGEAGP